jgi:hypothetical protein
MGELDNLIDKLDKEGYSQIEIYDSYDRFCGKLQKENRETEKEFVIDVIDTIVHWGNRDFWHHFSLPMTWEEYFKKYNKLAYNYYKKNNKDLSDFV